MFLRKILAASAIAAAAIAVPATAAFATTPTPGGPPLGGPPEGNHQVCPQDHQYKDCCPQDGNWNWGQKGGFVKTDGFPFGDTCSPQFPLPKPPLPKPPVCHELTSWVPSWGWGRDHRWTQTWRPVVTSSCGKCVTRHVDIYFNDEGGTFTNDVVYVGEKLTNATDNLSETVVSVHPLIIWPNTHIENQVLDFTVSGSCSLV